MRAFRGPGGKPEQPASKSPYTTAASRSASQQQARPGGKLNPLSPLKGPAPQQHFLPDVDYDSVSQHQRQQQPRRTSAGAASPSASGSSPSNRSPEKKRASSSTGQSFKQSGDIKQATLDELIAQYKDGMKKVNLEREILQSEVQRVLDLEGQREADLAHAVEVNESLMGEIQELQDSLSKEGPGSAQQKLIEQLQRQIDSLCGERDKALLETDQLYDEVQELRSQQGQSGSASKQQSLPSMEQLATEVQELAEDLEHGYKVLEGFKEDLDHQELEIGQVLEALQHDRMVLSQEVSNVQEELTERLETAQKHQGHDTPQLKVLLEKAAELDEWQDTAEILADKLKEKDSQLQRSLDMRARLEEELAEVKKLLPVTEAGQAAMSATSGSLDVSSVNVSMEASLRQQLDTLADQLEEEQRAHKKVKEALLEVQEAAEEASKQLAEGDDELRQSNLKEEALRAELRQSNLKEEALRSELRQSNLKEEALRAELQQLEKALMDAAKEQEDGNSARDDISDLKDKLEAAEDELQELRASTAAQEVEDLKRKVKEAREGREAAEESMREAMSATTAKAKQLRDAEESAGALAQRLREEEAATQDLEERLRAAAKLSQDSQASGVDATDEQLKWEERERLLNVENSRLVEQRETAEARGSVLSRELQASEAQVLQLRKALKGSGMLNEKEAADLRREVAEAQEEAQLMRDKSAFLEDDALDEVHRELSSVKNALSEARRTFSSAMKEESEARQKMARQLRHAIIDLQEDKRLLSEELEMSRRASPSRPRSVSGRSDTSNISPRRADGLDDLPVPYLRPSPDPELKDLEHRNLQVQFESRLVDWHRESADRLRRSADSDKPKRDRLFKEARDVHAESEFRLKETLASHEDLMLRTASLMAMTDGPRSRGALEDELMSDRKYRQVRGRIEDLEERLMRRITSAGKQGEDSNVTSRQLQELLSAQRDVGDALKKLMLGQSMLQERQDRQEAKQGIEELRSSLEMLDAVRRGSRSEPPARRHQGSLEGRAPPQHPLSYGTPGELRASFSDWRAPSPAPYMAYADNAGTPPGGAVPVHLSPYAAFAPPSASQHHNGVSPGGVLISNLYQFAPPRWRQAHGMAPSPSPAAGNSTINSNISTSRTFQAAAAPPSIHRNSSSAPSVPAQATLSHPAQHSHSSAVEVGPAPPLQDAWGAGSAVAVRRPSPEQQSGDGARLAIDVPNGVSDIRGAGVSMQPEAAGGGREATDITPPEEVAPSAAYGSGDLKGGSPLRRVSSPPWRSPWE